MDMELYGKKVVVEPEDGDTSKVLIEDVDLTLFFAQFSVPDILDQLQLSDIQEYVQKELEADS
jgi:hypothetical protein